MKKSKRKTEQAAKDVLSEIEALRPLANRACVNDDLRGRNASRPDLTPMGINAPTTSQFTHSTSDDGVTRIRNVEVPGIIFLCKITVLDPTGETREFWNAEGRTPSEAIQKAIDFREMKIGQSAQTPPPDINADLLASCKEAYEFYEALNFALSRRFVRFDSFMPSHFEGCSARVKSAIVAALSAEKGKQP